MQSNSSSSNALDRTYIESFNSTAWILQLKLRWKPGSGALLPLSATKMQKISPKIALNETYRFNVSASVFCQKSTSALQNAKFSRVSLWTQRQEKRKSTPLSLSVSLSCSCWFVLAWDAGPCVPRSIVLQGQILKDHMQNAHHHGHYQKVRVCVREPVIFRTVLHSHIENYFQIY